MENENENSQTQPQPQEGEAKPKHPGGRPRILQSVEQAEALVELYFKTHSEKPTICGLATGLGFEDKKSLKDYMGRDDEFSTIVKKAVNRIEERHEERMYEPNCSGSIFWLKNRDWKDRHDITSGDEVIKSSIQIIAPPGAKVDDSVQPTVD